MTRLLVIAKRPFHWESLRFDLAGDADFVDSVIKQDILLCKEIAKHATIAINHREHGDRRADRVVLSVVSVCSFLG